MNNETKIIDWLIAKTKEQSNQINNSEHTEIRLQTLEQVKTILEWNNLGSFEKQAKRILLLARHKKENWDCNRIATKIILYEKLTSTIPYIIALNNNNNQAELLEFCFATLKELDLTNSDQIAMPKIEEINHSFSGFIELKSTFRNALFDECYKKIEALYEELISAISRDCL